MTAGITGHRDFIKDRFVYHKFLEKLLYYGVDALAIGGAAGFDEVAGKIAIRCGLEIHLYLPYKGFCKSPEILEHCTSYYDVTDKYTNNSIFHKRNKLIVDNSDVLFCWWDGRETGGTYSTVLMAQEAQLPIENFY